MPEQKSAFRAVRFYNQVNRPFMSLVVLVSVVAGAVMAWSGIQRTLDRASADSLLLVGLGLLTLWLGWRVWAIAWRPRFEVDPRAIRIARFIGTTKITWPTVKALATFETEYQAKSYVTGAARSLPLKVHVPMLAVLLTNGRVKLHALPQFGSNQQCLDALQACSGMRIESLGGPEAIAQWQLSHS